ncbi:MAG: DUF2017 family protein [Acidimicrobiaceae bacterium]|nr:DUF2017 family protein [Acidimicrobiaceae bacterium]
MKRFKPQRRFWHSKDGVRVDLSKPEQRLLAEVLEQFRHLLFSGSDPHLVRLEPPACLEDPFTELEYRAMAANHLLQCRLEAIEIVENGLHENILDPEMVAAWMQTLNGVRLYLSEKLRLHADKKPPYEPTDSTVSATSTTAKQPQVADQLSSSEVQGDTIVSATSTTAKQPQVADQLSSKLSLIRVYEWLGVLLEELVAAATASLPDETS